MTMSSVAVKQCLKGREYTATVTDTECTNLENRVIAYNRADVVIVCFSLVNQSSFKNVKDKWLEELDNYCPSTPILLVGTQSDLVHNPNIKRKDIVTFQQIQKLLRCQRIHDYCESSAFTKDGLSMVFHEAFNAAWIGPVRCVMRMKTVNATRIDKLRSLLLPCLYSNFKQ